MSERIEFLSKQILTSVGSDKAILTVKLYDEMIKHNCFRDLTFTRIRPTPQDIVKAKDFVDLGKKFGVTLKPYDDEGPEDSHSLSGSGEMGGSRFEGNKKEFIKMKESLIKLIEENSWTVKDFLKD